MTEEREEFEQKIAKVAKGEERLTSDDPILLASHAEGVVNFALAPLPAGSFANFCSEFRKIEHQ